MNPKRILKIVLWTVLGLLFALYILMPFGFGFFATLRFPKEVDSAPQGFEEVVISTDNDHTLSAWYHPSENGKTILLVHGATDSREGIRKHAIMLAKNGYGVLAYDQSGHGESSGEGVNGFGWSSQTDIQAVLDYLKKEDTIIGALGLSMGGEALLSGASEFHQIRAIISEGATYRSIDDYKALPGNENIVRYFTTNVMYISAGLFGQEEPPKPILESLLDSLNTQFLLIGTDTEANEVDFNTFYHEQIPEQSELWIIPDVSHTGGIQGYPSEYELKVIGFFDRTLD